MKQLDLREIVKYSVKTLEFLGFFTPKLKKPFTFFYYVYAAITIGFLHTLFSIGEMIAVIMAFNDLEKMAKASFLLLTHIVEGTKLYIFLVHNSRVRKLIDGINRAEFQPKNQEQYNLLQNDIKVSKQITTMFLFMGFATCMLWAIFPFLERSDKEEKVELPLSLWFPFHTDSDFRFVCAFIYQVTGSTFNAMANISMDAFLTGTIMVVSSQLKVLNNSFRNLKGPRVRQKFIQNIVHHQNILDYSNELIELFTTCILAQFSVSVIIICMTMLEMSLVSVASLQFLSMALYQSCMLLEIFLWCYYGNEVIVESDKLTTSAFSSDWINSSEDFKKNLLFFMTRTQVPLKLFAGDYFSLSLDTFTTIVKSSWSYFAVLNRVHKRNEH